MKERCKEILERAEILLDGEIAMITEEQRLEIETHLEECQPCFERYGLEEHFVGLIHRLRGGSPCPEDLRAKITNHLREA
jgi:mycothiol system anti-sigma-R factor